MIEAKTFCGYLIKKFTIEYPQDTSIELKLKVLYNNGTFSTSYVENMVLEINYLSDDVDKEIFEELLYEEQLDSLILDQITEYLTDEDFKSTEILYYSSYMGLE